MDTDAPPVVVTPIVADAALHFFGRGGRSGGDFLDLIFRAVAKADGSNREVLRRVYPSVVAAYELGHEKSDGIDILAEIAGAR